MLPIVTIVGSPNVGKSTLFNCLTRSTDALVIDLPGTTRDRNYGEGKVGSRKYIVVDTGGVGFEENAIDDKMSEQSWEAVAEADVVLFLVDGRSGCSARDPILAQRLRELKKPVLLVVNKTDGMNEDIAIADFFALGLGTPIAIAASHSRGVAQLAEEFCSLFAEVEEDIIDDEEFDLHAAKIKVAIVGRPNAGKSTLVNRILGQDRMVVFDAPGTTRDSIFIPMERDRQEYVLIDTAGVRRKAKITEKIEKFSIIKALQAVEASNVVILIVDATTGIVDQDLSLMDFIVESGRCLIIAINKWDGLASEQKEKIKDDLNRRLHFVDFAEKHFISALHGTGVGNLFASIVKAYNSAIMDLSTPKLTALLKVLVTKHTPPVAPGGRRIKLRYAHAGGKNPPRIIIHGNQTEKLPGSYKRYLVKAFQKELNLVGTPVLIEFKTSSNPYGDSPSRK